MIKKRFLVLAIILAMTFSLFGCFGDVPNNTTDLGEEILRPNDDSANVTVVSNNTENISGTGYADELLDSRLRQMTPEQTVSDYSFVLTKKIHNYNVKNNNIRVSYTDWGWDDGLSTKVMLAFTSQSGPDIITGEYQMPSYMNNNWLKPFPDELATKIRSTMLPATYKSMEKDGKIYGVATSYSPVMMVWNKAVIKDALGADSKYINEAPRTWSEFIEVCTAINASSNRISAGGPYAGANPGGYLRTAPFVYMNGGKLTTVNDKGQTGPLFNDPKSIEAFEFLNDVGQQNMEGTLDAPTEAAVYNLFNQGRIAYIIDASWRYVVARDEVGLDVGLAPLPIPGTIDSQGNVVPSEDYVASSMVIGAPYLSVPFYVSNSRTANAFKFIESVMSKEVQQVVADIGFRPTANIEIAEGAEYASKKPDQFMAYQELKKTPFSLPSFLNSSSQIWGSYGTALSNSINAKNKASIAGFWNTANSTAQNAPGAFA